MGKKKSDYAPLRDLLKEEAAAPVDGAVARLVIKTEQAAWDRAEKRRDRKKSGEEKPEGRLIQFNKYEEGNFK